MKKNISAKLSFTNKFGAATRTHLKSSFTEKEQCTLILTLQCTLILTILSLHSLIRFFGFLTLLNTFY